MLSLETGIEVKGTEEDVARALEELRVLAENVKMTKHSVQKTGVAKFFATSAGRRKLEDLQTRLKVMTK